MTITIQECPWCGMEITPWARRHLIVCPRNPALRPNIIRALADAERPGYAVSYAIYWRRAGRVRAPSLSLLYRAWGSWPVICAEFGLIWEPVRRRGKQRV